MIPKQFLHDNSGYVRLFAENLWLSVSSPKIFAATPPNGGIASHTF